MEQENNSYEDIIHLEHPISKKYPQMSISARAAQFSPFAALTGYEDAIKETARVTDHMITLDESEIAALDEKLRQLQEDTAKEAQFTYFVEDFNKEGGSYQERIGRIKKVDQVEQMIRLEDGIGIPMKYLVNIEFIS